MYEFLKKSIFDDRMWAQGTRTQLKDSVENKSGFADLFLYNVQPATKEDTAVRGYKYKESESIDITFGDFNNTKNFSRRRVLVIGELKGEKKESAVGSQEIDIKAEYKMFLRILVQYLLMEEEELDGNRYVTIASVSGHFVLEPQPFFSIPSIASRTTTCWLTTKDGKREYLVKDSWRLSERSCEGAFLKHATGLGVQGIAEYVGHEDIQVNGNVDNIFNNVLKGIDHGDNDSDWILKTIDGFPLKTSTKHQSDTSNTQNKENVPGKKPNSLSTSRKVESVQKYSLPIDSPALPSKPQKSTASLQDRIHTRLITRSGKRPETFASIVQLLEALRDAIRGHQSLYLTGNILHRDISINNVMIATLELEWRDGFKGNLVDLDMTVSTDLAGDRKVAHHRTGTLEFMSLNVLKGGKHTFRDDLESFFYVLLYICFKWNAPKQPKKELTPIDRWSLPDFERVYEKKFTFMTSQSNFVEGLNEMTAEMSGLRSLLRDLRGTIRRMDTEFELGSPEMDAVKLYGEFIDAFNDAIDTQRQRDDGAMVMRSGLLYKI
ncbi:hypothetical protein RUND412_009035 [Rhizina undulata]